MKAISFFFIACLSLSEVAQAQYAVSMDSSKLEINTAGDISIVFTIWPDLTTTLTGDLAGLKPRIEVRSSRTEETLIPFSIIGISPGRKSISFVISYGKESRKNFLEFFRNSSKPIYFYMSDSLKLVLADRSTLVLTPAQIRDFTSQQALRLTQSQVDELLDAENGYMKVFNNKFDVGLRNAPSDTTDPMSYIEFTFVQTLFKGAYTQFSGLLTSNLNDDVANVRITPFAFRIISKQSFVVNTFMQSTLNGNEVRMGGSLFYNGLFPNFMNLTQGHNRLRPKPIVNIGFNIGYYSKSTEPLVEKKVIAEPFIDLEYYIPVQDKYTLYLQLHAFWRSNPGVLKFNKKNAGWHWNLAVHYSVPGFTKIIGKYSYGTDAFTKKTDNRLMFGFLVDFVEQ